MIYQRLLNLKRAGEALSKPSNANPPPALAWSISEEILSRVPQPNGAAQGLPEAAGFYDSALNLAEKLFGGELDSTVFEDYMRAMFGTQAYTFFTIDKLVGALIKLVRNLICYF